MAFNKSKQELLAEVDAEILNDPKNQNNYEIEIRIGNFDKNYFASNINTNDFYRILEYFLTHLNQMYLYIPQETSEQTELLLKKPVKHMPDTVIQKSYYVTKNNTRYTQQIRESYLPDIPDAPKFYSTKKTISTVDLPNFFVRFSKASEQNLGQDFPLPSGVEPQSFRRKDRWSFVLINEDPNHPLFPFRIDLTRVTGWSINKNGKKSDVNSHEIELEIIKLPIINAEKQLWGGIHFMLELVQNTRFPVTSSTIQNVIFGFNSLFESSIIDIENKKGKNWTFDRNTKIFNIVNKPRNLKLKSLFSTDLSITDKANGERRLLFFRPDGVYLLYPPNNVMLFLKSGIDIEPNIAKNMANTILDGELVLLENGARLYLSFDLLVERSTDLRFVIFKNRIKRLRELLGHNPVSAIAMKEYKLSNEGNFYQRINAMLDEIPNKNYSNDGLIINKENDLYPTGIVEKWKPPNELTIDFHVEIYKNDNLDQKDVQTIFKLFTKLENNKLILFEGSLEHPNSGKIFVEKSVLEKFPMSNGQIVEMAWDFTLNSFIPRRIRYDREYPNKHSVALDVWNDIMNPILEKTIRGHDLILMRKYHNIVKSKMIENCKNGFLVDIGSGRGGDIHKWIKNKINVFAVEPNSEHLIEFVDRLTKNGYVEIEPNNYIMNNLSVQILNAFGQETKFITEKFTKLFGENKADCVSIFNALTFFFDTEKSLDSLINTINNVLKVDGLFMGMVMDGELVKQLLVKHVYIKEKIAELSNDEYYNIDTQSNINKKDLGTRFINKKYKITSIDKGKLDKLTSELDEKDPEFVQDYGWKITRESEFSTNPFGNKINIHLDDTIVVNQTEYLVNFNMLVHKFAEHGFVLIEDFFLSNEYLSPSQIKLNELYRTFIFKKTIVKPESSTISDKIILERYVESGDKFISIDNTFLQADEILPFEFNNKQFMRIGLIRNGECILDGLLRASNKEYSTEITNREKIVDDLFQKFIHVYIKNAYDNNELQFLKENYKDWFDAKEILNNCINWFNLDLWNVLTFHFKSNIIVIISENPFSEPKIQKTATNYDNTIILHFHDGIFETIGKKGTNDNIVTFFDKNVNL